MSQSQGRCSAKLATTSMLLCLLFAVALHSQVADAVSTFVVGGAQGWTFNTNSWTRGKRFSVGDTLVFKYSPAVHNVVAVSRAGYAACTAPKGATVYQTGKDQIKLKKGPNYFICSIPGHCASGMIIAITV